MSAHVFGDVVSKYQSKRAVCVLAAQGTANLAPTLAAQGVPTQSLMQNQLPSAADVGLGFLMKDPLYSTVMIFNTAGTGAVTGTFVLWGYLEAAGVWLPIKKLNGGSAIPVYSGTSVLYTEAVDRIGHFDRVYLELQAPGGTTPTFEAWIATGMSGAS